MKKPMKPMEAKVAVKGPKAVVKIKPMKKK